MSFAKAFHRVVLIEGGYADNPNDPGGKTRYGITEATARRHGYTGAMSQLPLHVAQSIYKSEFWDDPHFDRVDPVSEVVADKLFDAGVNVGTLDACEWLQQSLNAANAAGTYYPDITVDGNIGPHTVGALSEFLKRYAAYPCESVLVKMIDALQGGHYISIAKANPKEERFVFGWFNKRIQE